jgi:carbon monoxide dehydrogenase subunit G
VPTYTRETPVGVDDKAAYAYLSDVQNLPTYFPMITRAERTSGDEVETTAVIEPPGEEKHTVKGTAWFKQDDAARKVTWGSEGPNDYHGEIDVDADGDAASVVRFTLHTESGHPGIEESIDETLATIKATLEGGGQG